MQYKISGGEQYVNQLGAGSPGAEMAGGGAAGGVEYVSAGAAYAGPGGVLLDGGLSYAQQSWQPTHALPMDNFDPGIYRFNIYNNLHFVVYILNKFIFDAVDARSLQIHLLIVRSRCRYEHRDGNERVRELRGGVHAAVETRRYRPLPVQRVRSLQQGQRGQPTAAQGTEN